MDLRSSFGPLGWRKIISNQGGSVIITKDGQLIASCVDTTADGTVLPFLWRNLIAAAESCGDGIITNSILVFGVVNGIEVRLLTDCAARDRIRTLRVIEALLWVANQYEVTIRKALVKANIWTDVSDAKSRLVDIVRSVTVPSSNAAVAQDVIAILVFWLNLNNKQVSSDEEISVLCRRILTNFDTLVHIVIGKTAFASRCYAFTFESEIIIKGRCRDYSALSSYLLDEKSIQFVCILHILPAAHTTVQHTVKLSTSLNALSLHRAGHTNIELLVTLLGSADQRSTRVIFCGDAVNDEAMQVLAQSGLYVIDCIPPAYLSYIAKRTGCELHLSPQDLFKTSQMSHSGVAWQRFHHLERTIFGTRQEVHYKLCGICACDLRTQSEPRHEVEKKQSGGKDADKEDANTYFSPPLQVVLRGASSLSVGVHVRMLQRSLKAIIFSLSGKPAPHNSPNISHTSPAPLPLLLPAEDHFNQHESLSSSAATTMVPGAGAGELGWSLLWRQVARNLAKRPHVNLSMQQPSSLNTHHPSEESSTDTTSSFSFEVRIASLVKLLSDALFQRVGATHAQALCECATMCQLLSDAYRQVPLQCVINSFDVLPDFASVPAARSRSPQAVLLHWEECFCRSGPATGRVGLMVESDPFADDICSFQDALHGGVGTSFNHFWSGFLAVLHALQLCLRVGEVIPVKKRQLLPSQPVISEHTDEDSDVDALMQSFW